MIDSKNEDSKFNGIWISLALHIAIFSFFILQNVFFPSDISQEPPSIRVDLVGLPDKISQPPTEMIPENKSSAESNEKKMEPKDAIKEIQPESKETSHLPDKSDPKDESIKLTKKTEPKKEDSKKKQKEALDKIKKLSAIEAIKDSLKNETTNKSEKNKNDKESSYDNKNYQYKGNVINPGTALTGINKLQHDNYVSLLDQKIKDHWALPQWLANKDYKAQALIKIDEKGNLISNVIYKSSGNSSYDDIVLETINKSSPFPTPPEKFVAVVGVKGILIGFPE